MGSDQKRGDEDRIEGGAPSASGDERLDRLRKKLDEIKQPEEQSASRNLGGMAGIGQAMKLGSEFVAGVIVGFVIGYTIDQLFGTKPWGMIIFLMLGFAAGTLNVMRSVGMVAEKVPPSDAPDNRDKP